MASSPLADFDEITGEKRSDIAVVIPAEVERPEAIAYHLGLLNQQRGAAFDVLLIGNTNPGVALAPHVNLRCASVPRRLGLVRAFSQSHKLAYALGYRVVITTDCDATPIHDTLVARIAEEALRHGCLALPFSRYDRNMPDAECNPMFSPTHYGATSAEAVAAIGTMHDGYFAAAIDPEYMMRAEAAGRLRLVYDVSAEHKCRGRSDVDMFRLSSASYDRYTVDGFPLTAHSIAAAARYGNWRLLVRRVAWAIFVYYDTLLRFACARPQVLAFLYSGLARRVPRLPAGHRMGMRARALKPGERILSLGVRGVDGPCDLPLRTKAELIKSSRIRTLTYLLWLLARVAFSPRAGFALRPKATEDYAFFVQSLVIAKPMLVEDTLYIRKNWLTAGLWIVAGTVWLPFHLLWLFWFAATELRTGRYLPRIALTQESPVA